MRSPESFIVEEKLFNPYMKQLYQTLCEQRGINKAYNPTRKLLLNQFDKENYVVHFAILKFYLKMGMKLKKIHQGIRFTQKPWLKSYIEMNSEKRALAKNDFEKDYYKLKNNALYGKTMENMRKRIDYKLVNDEQEFERLASHPLYIQHDVFSKDLVGVHMFKSSVLLDRPQFVGQAVLDYSKLTMYEFFYHTIRTCPVIQKARVCGGDTDSFFLALETEPNIKLNDIYQALSDVFDSSNYPKDHELYSTKNKARLGCFKDETAGHHIEEFILLRPKMYSMKVNKHCGVRRAKGIRKNVVHAFSHNDYRDIYTQTKENQVQMTLLKSENHQVSTTNIRKRGLSIWDDKRCWKSKNFSVPYGHYSLNQERPTKRSRVLPTSGDVQ